MALVFDICKVGNTADCSKIFIEDKTVYGVTPDNRSAYALFLTGFFYNENADDSRLVIDNLDPLNIVTWEVDSTSDGYHYFDLLPILVWEDVLSFSVGDICYQNTFYWKALTNNSNENPTNTEGTHWEKVEDPYSEVGNLNELGNPVIEQVTRYDMVSLCRANICYGEVASAAAEKDCSNCSEGVNKDFMRVDVLLQSAYIQTGQTKYTTAHKTALLLQDICNDLTDCGCS